MTLYYFSRPKFCGYCNKVRFRNQTESRGSKKGISAYAESSTSVKASAFVKTMEDKTADKDGIEWYDGMTGSTR